MTRDIQAKARSQRGLALPIALLLFLICALLASVVLAAATGVSGRHTQLAQADQRYYSVASAAQLMQNEFTSQPVVITCEQEKKVTTVISYAEDGSAQHGDSTEQADASTFSMTVNGKSVVSGGSTVMATEGLTLPELTALYLFLGGKTASIDPSAVMGDSQAAVTSRVEVGTYTLQHTPATTAGFNAGSLTVKVHESLLPGNQAQLRLDSAGSGETDVSFYSLTLLCVADVDVGDATEEGAVETSVTSSSHVETRTVKAVRTATVSWSPSELVQTAGDAA